MSFFNILKSKFSRKASTKVPTMAPSRIKLTANPLYKKSGTKSYLYAMRKYQFSPTQPGPYSFGTTIQQTGRQYTEKPVGGRVHSRRVLQKKAADSDQVGEVSAEDVQNDSEYLATVGIGSPAQNLTLDFDTGSADLWVSLFRLYTSNTFAWLMVDSRSGRPSCPSRLCPPTQTTLSMTHPNPAPTS